MSADADIMARPAASDPGVAVLRGEVRPEFLRDETLSEIFGETVGRRAAHVAMVFGERRLTYAEVDQGSDAIARGLVRLGIGPGDVVGLWMGRGADLLVAQIAITKTGAAWLPFDADAPADRIAVCLADAGAKGLLTDAALSARAPTATPILTAAQLVDPADMRPVPRRAEGLTPEAPAYLIYTSGSTGVPKGIVITQRNICHFLRSANALYGLVQDDVVFQGASVAFDLSMEEIWIPLMVGATLFVATPALIGDVERLPDLLTEAGVTVLDTVPTLLGLLPRQVVGLRLILLGGEALPAPLVARWSRPGCRLFNTYGPTEATVVATACEATPGTPVTIGTPIANYTAYVVDEAGRLCRPGQPGELWIGGPGVARGYLQRPELTAEKFVKNPFDAAGSDPVLYRSGDAVSLTDRGELAFHGRIDDQVKIRGFRVELGEIETRISHQPAISQAAVVLRTDEGIERLVAFLVPDRGAELTLGTLRATLRREMPAYMVPDHFETQAELPRLSSGKVDRKALRARPVEFKSAAAAGEQETPADETEAAMLVAAQRVFGSGPIGFEADFFSELGGHSLLAARFISAVREVPALAAITLQDVYEHRTLRKIAATLVTRTGGVGAASAVQDRSFEPAPLRRRFLCGLAQACALPIILSIATAQWLGVLTTYQIIAGEGFSLLTQLSILFAVFIGMNVLTSTIAIAGKWIVIGRIKAGRYPIWGAYFYRWWLARQFTSLINGNWFQGSPAFRVYLRLLGAKIGRDVVISEVDIGAYDLISIGDGTTLGAKVALANAQLIGNELVIGPITIGRDVSLGATCAIPMGCEIGDHCELADLTALPEGARLGPAERWDGSPGRRVGTVDVASLPEPAVASDRRRLGLNIAYGALLLVVPSISLLPLFPAFYIFDWLDDLLAEVFPVPFLYYLPILAWPTAMMLITLTVGTVSCMRWLILPRLRPGRFSMHSGLQLRKWAVTLINEVTLDTLASLYATVYMRLWYRLMGTRIGPGSEISSNLAGRYDLTEIGRQCFIADYVIYGDEDVRRGWVTLDGVRTLDKVFVGNDAVLPQGAVIPAEVLIGVKSKPPANDMMAPGDTWFGSPPIKLPNRQRVTSLASQTFEPSRAARIGRAVFELFRTSLPTALFIVFGVEAAYLVFYPLILERAWTALFVQFVVASVVIALLQTLLVTAVKWMLMGVYRPVVKPMWSWWALRTESVAVLYWGFSGKVLLDHLCCTPFLPWILRLFGSKLGQGVCLNSTDVTEFDCVTIGDHSVVNSSSLLQTHLFEDRVMKVGRIELGRGVSVMTHTTVLYDTKIGDFAVLRPLTVIMKGESIPAHTEWEGAPAVPVLHAPATAAA